jgi:Na+-translocating ferredoxin:NAD+ oxidoreductase RnfG subunit
MEDASPHKENRRVIPMRRILMSAAVLFSAILVLWASSVWTHESAWPGKRLAEVFPKAKKFKARQVTLTAEQIARLEKETGSTIEGEDKEPTFYIAYGPVEGGKSGELQPMGAVVFIDAVGQHGNMEVNVAITPKGTLQSVSLWKHQESKQLESQEFLKQFEGDKKAADAFQVGKDITAVPGAEKASQAMATAAKRGLLMFQEVFGKKDTGEAHSDSTKE